MTEAFKRYRHLEEDLVFVRWLHRGFESEKEDELLDEMEQLWWELEDPERALLEAAPPRSLIRESLHGGSRCLVDSDVDAHPATPPRVMREAV